MPDINNKSKQLEERTVNFSVRVIKRIGKYSSDKILRSLVDQLIRSATSVDANYAEANNSSSKMDFRNKIYIAKKEIAETRYWFRVLSELLPNEDFSELQQEAKEINMILQKIVSSLKKGNQ